MIVHNTTPPTDSGTRPAAIRPELLEPCGEYGPDPIAAAGWVAGLPVWPALLADLGLGGRNVSPAGDVVAYDAQNARVRERCLGRESQPKINDAVALGLTVLVSVQAPEWGTGGGRVAVNEDGTRGVVINRPQRELPTDDEMKGYARHAAGATPDVD